jgi:DNA-binding beta-propeller fold protein YncE
LQSGFPLVRRNRSAKKGQGTNLNLPVGIAVDGRGNVYVTNQGGASIEEFAPSSSAPVRTVAGPATGLDQPVAIALDTAGNMYVANQGSNSVTVYAAAAQGNVAPTRIIAGASTAISYPEGLALDAAGNVWVTNLHGGEPGAVTVFARGASGDVPPMATLTANNSTYAFNPSGIAILPP